MKISRGDVFLAKLDPTIGSEIKKTRPVVIVSNDISNEFSRTVTVLPITSKKTDRVRKFEALLLNLEKPSKVKADQIRTLDKSRLFKKLSRVDDLVIQKINKAIMIHLDLI